MIQQPVIQQPAIQAPQVSSVAFNPVPMPAAMASPGVPGGRAVISMPQGGATMPWMGGMQTGAMPVQHQGGLVQLGEYVPGKGYRESPLPGLRSVSPPQAPGAQQFAPNAGSPRSVSQPSLAMERPAN